MASVDRLAYADGKKSFLLYWPLLAFEFTSDLIFESYNINLLCFHALIALFHTFSYFDDDDDEDDFWHL